MISAWEVLSVTRAGERGDVEAIQNYFEQWRIRPLGFRLSLDELYPALVAAVRNNQVWAADCSIMEGVPMNQYLFLYATRLKYYGILAAFVNHDWDIDTSADLLNPPALAIALNDANLVRWFLDNGANPNAACERGLAPTSLAVKAASFSIIKLLLGRGGDIQQGRLLHYVAMREHADRLEVLEFLLQRGLPVDHSLYRGPQTGEGTALHFAAGRGFIELVERLIEEGADPLVKDPTGQLVLHWAENRGHNTVASYLRPLTNLRLGTAR